MPATLTCVCGEVLAVPDAAQEVFCARCNKNVSVIAQTPKQKPSDTPPMCELVRDEQGREFWKLTCFCGKRVRTPANVTQPYGRCPQCNRRMKMPGYLLSKPKVLVSAQPGSGPVAAPSKHSSLISELVMVKTDAGSKTTAIAPAIPTANDTGGDIIVNEVALMEDDDETVSGSAPAVAASDMNVNLTAALTAADRLRPQRVNKAVGRISAWPLAEKLTRALAAFIDLTFATTLAGIVVVLALLDILPPILLTKELVVVLLMAAGVMNDGFVHVFWGESIGKMLVLIVTRTATGSRPSAAKIFARALLKWLVIPGWIIGAVDPHQRTLHDLICGTLVLKGRAKYR